MTITSTEKQELAWAHLDEESQAKYIIFGGGAGGGKSWLLCEWIIFNCLLYKGSKWFIGREELKRLMGSTYITFLKVCAHHKIPSSYWKLNGQYNYIEFRNGSRIDLLDLKLQPSDPLYERFGSLEYTGGAIEEAGEVHFMAFDVLKSRVGRHLNRELNIPSKILITCNPKKNWLYQIIYKPWKEGKLPTEYAFIQSLYGDNQFTAEEYGRNLSQIVDKATKQRLMFGNWEYEDDPNALMQYDAIVDLFTNTVEHSYDKFLTADIARYGADKVVVYCWNGFENYKQYEWTKKGIDQTITEIRTILSQEQIPYSHAVVDEDGVGGGVVDGLRGIKGFVNNSSPIIDPRNYQKQNFKNLKAQCSYMMADKINAREMSVKNCTVELRTKLIEELEQVKGKDLDMDGKLQLVPKEDVKELLGRSPDYADALMMRMYFEINMTGVPRSTQRKPTNLNRSPVYKVNF